MNFLLWKKERFQDISLKLYSVCYYYHQNLNKNLPQSLFSDFFWYESAHSDVFQFESLKKFLQNPSFLRRKVVFFLLNREEFKTEENPKYSGKVILYGLPKMRSTVTSHMSKLPLNEAWSIMRPIVWATQFLQNN